ncbi:hypothetical protein N781_09350 [Pontibacillus halophilus JSM 076056 = DSM 19796]|uniref:DUF11 domain-containing protein n=1 Tax=Pontibacillus halophilus JSM 076056 = DSM 19796 TaxID=1385510 RepID=A0A0A5GDW1_9BACI|nr:DUF11 domain-containing protein [Pontibacillus halophilus]KGX89315.1 hypothetical protein N781_09350 [Pontibacillus halophilus JSM 076056 = DSM 19796]
MAFVNRFSTLDCGMMTFTGNTLGLSQELNLNEAGTRGSIGAFITLDNTSQVPTFPPGTTLNYQENSSSAELGFAPGSNTVLYAELIWGGNYLTRDEDITSEIDNDVLFTDPLGVAHPISPDPATSNQFTFTIGGVTRGFYMRSNDVTSIVQSAAEGTYTCGSVPGLLDPLIASTGDTNHAGWTLAVVYGNPELPNRSMNLFVGGEGIVFSQGTPIIDIAVSGFMTPPSGDVDARLLISAQEGDANIPGDQALFGPDSLTLTNLSGPNNPTFNFSASQINGDDGLVDTSGTFGTRNQDAATQTNIVAGRQGWDITNVSGLNYLPNNQTTAVFRFTSTGDAYMPNALGIQIDEGDADPVLVKTVDKPFAVVNDVLTYIITITNEGVIEANNVVFIDEIPPGTLFVEDSLYIDGVQFPGVNPQFGVPLPNIDVGDTVTVFFQVIVRRCDCFVQNRAELEFSCGKVAESNLVTSTVCFQCYCGSGFIC